MQIYYSYIDKRYTDSPLSKREKEHLLGRRMVVDVAKSVYGIDDEIIYDGKRPYFKNNGVYFSISHSGNLVVAAFDAQPIGIDIEFVKPRNLKNLIKRYKLENKVNTLDDFYRWWTEYEAKYKNPEGILFSTFEIQPMYLCSVSYSGCASQKIIIQF